LFAHYWGRLLLTYALFNIENLLRLAQPFLLGLAIDGLLNQSYQGLGFFAIGHTAHMAIRIWRQMYDTRTFTRIYADRAGELIVQQRAEGIDISKVTARSALSREFVEFFERYVPMVVRSLYSIVGAMVMLLWFDWMLVLFCLAIALPAYVLNSIYGRRTLTFSGLLHDVMEREVDVIDRAEPTEVKEHFSNLSKWRVKLSDWEAITVGLMEFFVLALIAAALLRYCTLPGVQAGDIFAVFRYVMMYIMALDTVPMLVQQTSRLRDIGKRIGGKGRQKSAGRR